MRAYSAESLNRFRSWGIVLVLDLLGFCHQEGHDPPAIVLSRRYDGRISRILEHEQEHELSMDS